jgi:hypothetical protein
MTTYTHSDSGSSILVLYHTNHTVEKLFQQQAGGTVTSSVTKVGTKIPDWRRKIRLVSDATGAYSVDATQDDFVTGSIIINGKVQVVEGGFDRVIPFEERWQGPFLANPRLTPPTVLGPSADDTQARINFLNNVRNSRTSFQSGVFLGELREAIHMVVRPASALRQAVDTYLRSAKKAGRRARGSKAIAKAISGSWLEHSYGWRPMFSDIDSAMKALAKEPHVVPDVVSGTARSQGRSERTLQVNISGNSYLKNERYYTDVYDNSVRYKGAVAWGSSNLAPSWQSNWGAELREFVPTVYELIPYSFLVDYFTNIGDIINASSVGTVSLRWGCRTIRNKTTRKVVHVRNTPSTSTTKLFIARSFITWPTLTKFQLQRSSIASVGVSVMDLTFRCPGVSSPKWLNIAALATQKSL